MMSLCNDVVFKVLFSRHPHLLSDLINAVRYPAAPITAQCILNLHIPLQGLAGQHIVEHGVVRSLVLTGQWPAGQGYRQHFGQRKLWLDKGPQIII